MANKKKTLTKPLNQRMAVVSRTSRVRHVGTTTKFPQPLCGEAGGYGYVNWTASRAAKRHKLPICKKCVAMIQKLNSDLQGDPGWIEATIGVDKMLENTAPEFMDLLAEYGEWEDEA